MTPLWQVGMLVILSAREGFESFLSVDSVVSEGLSVIAARFLR